jgi:hypothetical protein
MKRLNHLPNRVIVLAGVVVVLLAVVLLVGPRLLYPPLMALGEAPQRCSLKFPTRAAVA